MSPRAESRSRAPRVVLVVAIGVGLALLVGLMSYAGFRELTEEASELPLSALIWPLVFSFLSYAAMARSYQGIADAAACRLAFGAWLRITFVSNTVNYVVTSGGISGFAVRMYLLGQHGVRSGRAVLISLVQTFLTNITLLFFILGGFVTLVVREQLQGGALLAAAVALIAFGSILAVGLVLVVNRRLRRLTLFQVARLAHRVGRRIAPNRTPRITRLWKFQHNLDEGLSFFIERKAGMRSPTFWICFDWVLTGGVLWAAFHAVQYPLPFSTVMVGFGVGIFFSLVSFVPGGLGVMDASMSGVFMHFGAPRDKAVLAVLLFRLCYQLLPLLISVFLAHGIFRRALRGDVPGADGLDDASAGSEPA